jgi:DNA-binding SARP family transcriptional activator
VLGPLEAARDGELVPLGGAKQRALLAALLVRANQVVPVDRLIDELWGDQPPESAPNALQGYVSALRKVLEPHRGPKGAPAVLVTRPPGYAIHAGAAELDLLRFEELLDAGRQALAAGDPGNASTHLAAALALWRGPALADVAYEPFAEREIGRLEELRLGATEDLVHADLALGRHQKWAGQLDALVEDHPLRERLAGQLMLALYRSGRQAEALRVYGRLRAALREELGIDPSDELRELETAILQQRSELRWTGSGAAGSSGGARAVDAGAAMPLPARLDTQSSVTFCGRIEERRLLDAVCEEVEAGALRTVAVEGDPGMGKTRLAMELAGAAHARGWSVLDGRCDEDLGIPYQPFVEAFSYYVEHTPDDVLGEQLRENEHLARILPAASRRLGVVPATPSSDPETERYLLLEAAVGLLAAASAERPLLLFVDDLHWADRNTLLLFRHVARSTMPLRVLLLGAYRGSDLAEGHPLRDVLSLLQRDEALQHVAVRGLEQPDVHAMTEVLGGRFLDDDGAALSTMLLEETGGNPLFVLEILRHLAESGVLVEQGGTWRVVGEVAQVALPESVRDVINRRVGRLGPDAQRVLTTAALIGRVFDIDLLGRVLGDDEDTVLAVLEAADGARLVVEHTDVPGTFSFAHALVAHALSDQVGPTRRSQVHRRVAEALEALCGDEPGSRLPQLASHWVTAVGADRDRAVHYVRLAGDQALAQLAPDHAADWYRKALELLPEGGPDVDRRCDVLISLGTALRDAGDGVSRRVLLHAAGLALELGDGTRLARAALANSRGGVSSAGEVDLERVGVLESALSLVGPEDSADRSRLLALLAMELVFDADWERRVLLADEALAVARRLDDRATLVHVLNLYADAVWVPHTLGQRLAVTAEHEKLAELLDDPVQRAFAALRRLRVAWEAADIVEVDRQMKRFSSLAHVHPYLRWNAVCQWPHRLLLDGRIDDAEAKVQEAFEVGQAAENPDAFQVMAAQLVMVRWDQGRLPELEPLLNQVAIDNPGIPGFRSLLELALCEADRLGDAGDHFAEDAAAGFDHVQSNPLWLSTMAQFAEVCAAVKDAGAAAVLYDLLLPWRDQIAFTGVSVDGSVAHHLGQLAHVMGRLDDADRHFAQAAAAYERMGAVNFLARTRLSWGRLLFDSGEPGDLDRATQLVEQAHVAAAGAGMASIERRCRELVAALTTATAL